MTEAVGHVGGSSNGHVVRSNGLDPVEFGDGRTGGQRSPGQTRPDTSRTRDRMPMYLWRPAFIAALGESGNVTRAIDAAGVRRSTAYEARQRDPEFNKAWTEALARFRDNLEAEAWKRATIGKSDRILELLLKANMPEKYGDRLKIDVRDETRRMAKAMGLTDEETEMAVQEAEKLLRERREEQRMTV